MLLAFLAGAPQIYSSNNSVGSHVCGPVPVVLVRELLTLARPEVC